MVDERKINMNMSNVEAIDKAIEMIKQDLLTKEDIIKLLELVRFVLNEHEKIFNEADQLIIEINKTLKKD